MAVLRIGMVGANPVRSWARDSHIPAIAQVPGLTLSAVATRGEDSARAAASAFGAPHWFADAAELCASDAVDLVVVCIKVPEHAAVVRAALAFGKHVLCEWPLGRSVEEVDALANEAARTGVHHATGLQASASPALRRACQLVAEGRLGRLRSARVVSTTSGYAARLPDAYAYLNDPANGANLSTILAGHTLDFVEHLLGPVREVDALATIQHPQVRIMDTGATVARTTPDQLFMLGRFDSGCVASLEVGGDRPADTPFTCEVIGDTGTLRLIGGHPHGFQAGELRLELDGEHVPLDAPLASGGLRGAAANVGEVYAMLARDIRDGTRTVPDFRHAARLTHVISTLTRAAESGQRQTVIAA